MGVEELLASPNGMRIEMLDADFDASGDAFLDAAAVIETLIWSYPSTLRSRILQALLGNRSG